MEVAELTLETFMPLAGATFRVGLAAPWDVELELKAAEALAGQTSPPGAFRVPFRLLFHGPASPVHGQAILPLENETLGRIEIFVVPIGPDGASGAMRYEAIFT